MHPKPYPMNPWHLERLQRLARSVGAAVWQDEAGRVHQRFANSDPHEVDTSTLQRAGWVRCLQPGAGCLIEGEHHVLGRRVACARCGALSAPLPALVLEQFIAGNKPAGEAG